MHETNTTIYLPICDKTVTAEAGCDYAMPDYQPEVRRLLRVKTTLLPATAYVGGGKAEFAGTVRYDVLYSAGDGALYAANFSQNYQMSAPLATDADVDYSDELPAFCEPEIELVTGRVTAPRRLSIRCRLKGRIKVFGRHRLLERIVGEVSEGSIQRLGGESLGAALTRPAADTFTLTEELPCDGQGDIRAVTSEATFTVSESVPSSEGVGCRGEAHVKVIACRETDGTPLILTAKSPFAVTIPADGFTPDTDCRVRVCATETTATVGEDGRILVELSATAVAEGQRNLPVHYTADLYSTERTDAATLETYRFPRADRCFTGNFTQSVYEPLTSFGLAPDAEVIDADAAPTVTGLSFEKGKWVVTGDTKISLLSKEGGEYAAHELSLPFRYETDGNGGTPVLSAVEVMPTAIKTRADGGRLSLECEMAVTARIAVEESIEALHRVEFREPVKKPREMVVTFPERGESLWSVAKRYHAPVGELARKNAVPTSVSQPLPDGLPIVVNE